MNFKGFLKKISYAISANIISLAISILTTLLVPKLVGVEEYSYFQLYLLYASYVGLLHFGWNDGFLLRLGGSRFNSIDKDSVYSQFLILITQQVLTAVVLALIVISVLEDPNSSFILIMTATCMAISGPMYMLLFLLQATARIKEYSQLIIFQRLSFAFLIILTFFTPFASYEPLVLADIASRLFALLGAAYFCRSVLSPRSRKFKFPHKEVRENLVIGLPLLISSMAGSLIIGVVRLGIERNWTISTFGKVSLALSLSTMVLTMIVAVGQVLFPLLRRAPRHLLSPIYSTARTMLSSLTIPALSLYFGLVPLIKFWLPNYSESAQYLGLLFPMFIYQVQTSILLEPYLKTIRREKILLGVNLFVLFLSVVATWVGAFLLTNLTVCLVSIVVLVALRAVALEFFVTREMQISFLNSVVSESSVVIVFLMSVIFLDPRFSFMFLACAQIAWFFLNRSKIQGAVRFLRT